METNYTVILFSALIPPVLGYVWYHPALFGKDWKMLASQREKQKEEESNIKYLGLSLILSVLLALFIPGLVIHQTALDSIFMGQPGMEVQPSVNPDYNMMVSRYGAVYRTFGHGLFHGIMASVFFVLPILGINALFERKTWKYILIHWAFWAITLGLMGGIDCAFA